MKRNIIRQLYLYAVSIISLFLLVFSAGQLVNLGLKTWVFTLADNQQKCDDSGNVYYGAGPVPAPIMAPGDKTTVPTMTDEQKAAAKKTCEENLSMQRTADKQSQLVSALSMLVVALPVFWFHFHLIQKERTEEREAKEEAKEDEKKA